MAFECEGTEVVRHNRLYLVLGGLPLVLAPAFLVAALVTGVWALAMPMVHLSILGTLGLSYAYKSNRDPVRSKGNLQVDEAEVRHAGKLLVRREELKAAFLEPSADHMQVVLHRRGVRLPITLSVETPELAREVMSALGFDASQTALELRIASQVFAWSLPMQLLVLLGPIFLFFVPLLMVSSFRFGPSAGAFAGVTILAMLGYIFGLLFSPTRVRVGVDGLVIHWLNHERFIPFSDISEVDSYKKRNGTKVYFGVAIDRTDGERVLLPEGQEGWSPAAQSKLLQRIRDARELYQRSPHELDPGLLARGERSPAEWLDRLRRIASGADADHRTAAISTDRVLGLMEDASSAPETRAAAAIVALETGDGAARERVRVAANTTASPRLRIALEQALDPEHDHAALAEALAELEADEKRSHASE